MIKIRSDKSTLEIKSQREALKIIAQSIDPTCLDPILANPINVRFLTDLIQHPIAHCPSLKMLGLDREEIMEIGSRIGRKILENLAVEFSLKKDAVNIGVKIVQLVESYETLLGALVAIPKFEREKDYFNFKELVALSINHVRKDPPAIEVQQLKNFLDLFYSEDRSSFNLKSAHRTLTLLSWDYFPADRHVIDINTVGIYVSQIHPLQQRGEKDEVAFLFESEAMSELDGSIGLGQWSYYCFSEPISRESLSRNVLLLNGVSCTSIGKIYQVRTLGVELSGWSESLRNEIHAHTRGIPEYISLLVDLYEVKAALVESGTGSNLLQDAGARKILQSLKDLEVHFEVDDFDSSPILNLDSYDLIHDNHKKVYRTPIEILRELDSLYKELQTSFRPKCFQQEWENVFVSLEQALEDSQKVNNQNLSACLSNLNQLIAQSMENAEVSPPSVYHGISSIDRKLGLFLTSLCFEQKLSFWKSSLAAQVIQFLDYTANPDSIPIPTDFSGQVVEAHFAPSFRHTWSNPMRDLGYWSTQRSIGVYDNLCDFGNGIYQYVFDRIWTATTEAGLVHLMSPGRVDTVAAKNFLAELDGGTYGNKPRAITVPLSWE